MSESQCCPVCDMRHGHPRWPFVRTTPWTDDCACSDYSHCMMHRYGDEQPPKRPSQEVMTARAQAVFERACEDHAHLLARFTEYEQLKKERDEARARVAELEAHVEHQQAHQKLLSERIEQAIVAAQRQRDADFGFIWNWLRDHGFDEAAEDFPVFPLVTEANENVQE